MLKCIAIICTIFFLLIGSNVSAQTKDSFFLRSMPAYDENGALYQVQHQYDHVPTSEDSILFLKESKIEVRDMIDSIQQSEKPKRKIKYSKYKSVNIKHKDWTRFLKLILFFFSYQLKNYYMENMDSTTLIVVSIISFIIGILITRWIFSIDTIVKSLKQQVV